MRRMTQALLVAITLLSGCATINEWVAKIYVPPEPWERDALAQDKMQIGGDPVQSSTDEHIYFSKEGSSIGRNIGGGGCGCN